MDMQGRGKIRGIDECFIVGTSTPYSNTITGLIAYESVLWSTIYSKPISSSYVYVDVKLAGDVGGDITRLCGSEFNEVL